MYNLGIDKISYILYLYPHCKWLPLVVLDYTGLFHCDLTRADVNAKEENYNAQHGKNVNT